MPVNIVPSTWTKAAAANNAGAFPALVALLAAPAGNGVIPASVEEIEVMIFGEGAANSTALARLLGWKQLGQNGLWVPKVLALLSGTLSDFVGLSGADINENQRFADAITVTSGGSDIRNATVPAETPASVIIPVLGYTLFQLQVAKGTGTNANALISPHRAA